MIISGLGANFEIDAKKVVALSTLSQLGLIIRALGAGYPLIAFFHIVVHAIFKARLFICVGFIIHSSGGFQDSRAIRGLFISRPVLSLGLGITNLSLCGAPFIAGFFSKDLIIERFYSIGLGAWGVLGIGVSVVLTMGYRVRFFYKGLISHSNLRGVRGVGDSRSLVRGSLTALLILSVAGG